MHWGSTESCRVVALVMQTVHMTIDKLAHIWYPFDLMIAKFSIMTTTTSTVSRAQSTSEMKFWFTVFENYIKSLIWHTSEASYICISSGPKLTKNAKKGIFWRLFENRKMWPNSVTRQVNFDTKKLMENAIIEKLSHLNYGIFHLFLSY